MSRPFDPAYMPDDPGTTYDAEALHAAEDAYERRFTGDGTPVLPHSSCDHWWQPLTGTLDECGRCGAVREALY